MVITTKTEQVNVKEVKQGDYIKSFNINDRKIVFNRVNEIIPSIIDKSNQLLLKLENGDDLIFSKNSKIYIDDGTGWHYMYGSELVKHIITNACYMLNDNQEKVLIVSIEENEEFAPTDFIDFNVEKDHNFFVKRPNNINYHLIHNSGACTVALDIWHMDIEDFLELQTENGDQRSKAFDIFPQIVIPDEFMRRNEKKEGWLLVDPHEIKFKLGEDIASSWGENFERIYEKIEKCVYTLGDANGINLRELEDDIFEDAYAKLIKGKENNSDVLKLIKRVNARELFKTIIKTQIETGMPYLTFKDAMNRANPNKHSGMIGNGNLCLSGDTTLDVEIDSVKEKIRMDDLVVLYKDNRNIKVRAFNHHKNENEYNQITDAFLTHKASKVLKIKDSKTGKFIICTSEHKIWTENRAYVKAKDLITDDVLKIEKNVNLL